MSEKIIIEDYRGLIDAENAAICPHIDCKCDLAYPIGWGVTAVKSLYKVILRCPNCERKRKGTMKDHEIDIFDAKLDAETDYMEASLSAIADPDVEDL